MKLRNLLIVLPLVGCATDPPIDPEAYRNNLYARCDGYGFQRGTTEFSQCVMQIDQQNRAAAIQILTNQPRPQPTPVYQTPRPAVTNCYTDSLGFTRCTTR